MGRLRYHRIINHHRTIIHRPNRHARCHRCSYRRWDGRGRLSENSMIQLEHVTVTAKPDAVLLNDLSVILDAPTTAIIGENGSGKSTLAKVLAGLIEYTGSATINDIEVAKIGRATCRERWKRAEGTEYTQ